METVDDALEQYLTSQTPRTEDRCRKCGFLLDEDEAEICSECTEGSLQESW